MEQTKTTRSDFLIDWYKFARGVLGIYVRPRIRKIQICGEELIPADQKIIVANHVNLTDCFVLPNIFTEKLQILIRADLYEIPVIGKLLELADQIPTRACMRRLTK